MKTGALTGLALYVVLSGTAVAQDTPVIAVASSFAPVMEEIAEQFTAATGHTIRISTGATGTLVSQIERSAPFEMFLSADEEHVFYLRDRGLARDEGRLYAVGVLVMYLPNTTRLRAAADVAQGLQQFFQRQDLRVAIANPELAPYGRAARQVLERFGSRRILAGRVILGENVGQVAQFALTGAVDAALLPQSLALDASMLKTGQFQIVPADWYAPLRHRMIVLRHAGRTATELYEYLSSDTARAIISNHGYALPPGN